MTLIERQTALVGILQPLFERHYETKRMAFCQSLIGRKSKAIRLHREEMMAAGYSREEAAQSAKDCEQVARVNADHAVFCKQMGA